MKLKISKTHVCAVLLIVNAIAFSRGWVNEKAFETITAVLMGSGLSFLRLGVTKEVKKVSSREGGK